MIKRKIFRRVLLSAIAAAAISTTALAGSPKPWDNGRLMVSPNNRFLQFANGKPFFWLGDTGWLLPQRLDRNEVAYYLKKCHDAGYNMVQVQVLNDVPSINLYGQVSNPHGWDMTKADPDGVYSYWDHLDYIVKTAADNGIYVGMVAIWGTQVQDGRINAAQAKAYGQFLAKRYKDCPNIIWIMGGDIKGDIHPEVWNAMATAIKAIDRNHLMSYHPRGRYTSARWWSKAPRVGLPHVPERPSQVWSAHGQRRLSHPRQYRGGQLDVCRLDMGAWARGNPSSTMSRAMRTFRSGLHDPNEERWQDYDVRRYAYWSVFAGSFGHTYGHNAIMQMLKPGYITGYGSNGMEKSWYTALNDPGYNQMRFVKDLMLSFPYFERVPDQTIIAGRNGKHNDRLIATRGNDYLMVYDYNSDPMPADMRKISGAKKKCVVDGCGYGRTDVHRHASTMVRKLSSSRIHIGERPTTVLIAVDADKNYIGKIRNRLP